jgi:hypothetical protein
VVNNIMALAFHKSIHDDIVVVDVAPFKTRDLSDTRSRVESE